MTKKELPQKYQKGEGFRAFLRLIISGRYQPISTMNNPDDPAGDGDQLGAPVRDYRILLKTTRPLVLTRNTALPSQQSIYRDQPISLEAGDCQGESVLKRGEIVCPDLSGQTATGDQGTAAAVDLPLTSSKLRIRIYIGMS
jgi:hypothetical protein